MTHFWEAALNRPKQKVLKELELRLYYDENGHVISYTTDENLGNYIIVDQQTYRESRYDLIVVNGKVVNPSKHSQVRKLVPDLEGDSTLIDDITIIGPGQQWKLKYYDAN